MYGMALVTVFVVKQLYRVRNPEWMYCSRISLGVRVEHAGDAEEEEVGALKVQ